MRLVGLSLAALLGLSLPASAWPAHGTGAAQPPITTSVQFGDLTPNDYGGAVVQSTSITGGANASDFTIVRVGGKNLIEKHGSGFANFASDCAVSCSVTGNAGETITITRYTTNPTTTYDVAAQSEWSGTTNGSYGSGKGVALLAVGSLSGNTIMFRSGLQIACGMTGGSTAPLGRKDFGIGTPLTVQSADLALIKANAYPTVAWPVDSSGNLIAGGAIGKLALYGTGTSTPTGVLAGCTDTITMNSSNVIMRGLVAAGGVASPASHSVLFSSSGVTATYNDTFDWMIEVGASGINGQGYAFGNGAVDHTNTFANGEVGLNGVAAGSTLQWQNSGYAFAQSGTLISNWTITNNTMIYRARGIVLADALSHSATANTLTGNVADVVWDSGFQMTYGSADTHTVASDNLVMREFSNAGTYGTTAPCGTCAGHTDIYHQDGIFFQGPCISTTTCGAVTDWHPDIERNIFVNGDSPGTIGAIRLNSLAVAISGTLYDTGNHFVATVVGNLSVGQSGGIIIDAEQISSGVYENNTEMANNVSNASAAQIFEGGSTSSRTCVGTPTSKRNVAETVSPATLGGQSSCVFQGNTGTDSDISMGIATGYATNFAGTTVGAGVGSNKWNPLGIKDALSVYNVKSGGNLDHVHLSSTWDDGAVGNGITFAPTFPGGGGTTNFSVP